MSRMAPTLLSLITLPLGLPAAAVDGVIEINQARAAAGSVTASDTPGWPVTIDAPGSYRLTGDLSPPANTTAIDITASQVTLDLGGFSITESNSCSGIPVTTCTTTLGNAGIKANAANQQAVTVRNGTVAGMGGAGVDGSSTRAMVVEDVRSGGNGASGIVVGDASRVVRCQASLNFGTGIHMIGIASFAAENQVVGNHDFGIAVNGVPGGQSSILRNVASTNSLGGYTCGASDVCLYSGNIVFGGGIAGGVSHGDNLCNGGLC